MHHQDSPIRRGAGRRRGSRSARGLLVTATVATTLLATAGVAFAGVQPVIHTFAGNGSSTEVDNGPATASDVPYPGGIATQNGITYIGETFAHKIRKVDASGTITTFGPTPAPGGLALDSQGRVYMADYFDGKVERVAPGGALTVIAGGGTSTAGNVPATSEKLESPGGLAFDSAGNLYIADGSGTDNRVLKVTPGGTLTVFAGTGPAGETGDGGPATHAKLDGPFGIAFDHEGRLLIADYVGNKVRRVDTNGVISTVAGNGTAGHTGDLGPATAAELDQPQDVAVDEWDNVYIADSTNNKVRRVTPGGTITTFAGTGTASSTGDGGLATSATIDGPKCLDAQHGTLLLVCDTLGDRVRSIQLHSPIYFFVEYAYADFLGRAPSTSELDDAVSALNGHAETRAQFIAGLAASTGWVRHVVAELYVQALDRAGSPSEISFWAGQIEGHHLSVADVAARLFASAEYYGNAGGTDAAFVTHLYSDLLGRSPDSGGLAYWEGRVAAEGRTVVALAFYQSPESRDTRVENLYDAILHRSPDTGGLDYWAGQIASHGDIALATSLASSTEYYERAQIRTS